VEEIGSASGKFFKVQGLEIKDSSETKVKQQDSSRSKNIIGEIRLRGLKSL
jgi:hypothetical protein